MKIKILVILISAWLLAGCDLIEKRSGLEVMSYPTAKVYIDGKEAGLTPYRNTTLKAGEIDIKLEAGNMVWIKKLHLESGANTVINREFGKNDNSNGGYILYFEKTGDEKKAALMISTSPDRATIKIDDEVKGLSPNKIEDISEGDKKLTIAYPGYKSLITFVKFIKKYQLVVEADLAKEEIITPEVIDEPVADVSTVSAQKVPISMVKIKQTETGWLRVRSIAQPDGAEVTKVKPNDEYKLLDESNGWYKIDLGGGKNGWISARYAEKKLTN